MSQDLLKEKALAYHNKDGVPGKVSVVPSKPCQTAEDLSLAYTPGVAKPVLEIAENPEDAYKYTSKGNLVAVISNGTAILGLGDRGALASKPVMEGKGVLFKRFADIDVFDIEIDETDPKKLIEIIKKISVTFGGINLEDIKGPECFEIERTLIEELDIPVFHDDQHGTAVIVLAGLLNALKVVGKKLEDVKIVIAGAGAAGIAICKFAMSAGAKNVILCDRKGAIYKGRTEGMNWAKEEIAKVSNPAGEKGAIADVMKGADVFLGLSGPGSVDSDMVKSMAKGAIVFAMANPTPEIYPDEAAAAGAAVIATGRSDFPNQINNCLGFPGIFRGALDVRASVINEEMKLAAAYALADLVAPGELRADWIIPEVMDKRVVPAVAKAVAEAARKTGVARI